MVEYLNQSEAAERLGVVTSTITGWRRQGLLEAGPDMGRAKTVTLASVEALEADEVFQQRLRYAQKGRGKSRPRQGGNGTSVPQVEPGELAKITEALGDLAGQVERLARLVNSQIDRLCYDIEGLQGGPAKSPPPATPGEAIYDDPELNRMAREIRAALAAGVPTSALGKNGDSNKARTVKSVIAGRATPAKVRLVYGYLQQSRK